MSDFLNSVTAAANTALDLWPVPKGATARIINVSENVTFILEGTGGYRAILRVHRRGYHTAQAISSELDWIEALQKERIVKTPQILNGVNGKRLQRVDTPDLGEIQMVLFDCAPGKHPDESAELPRQFSILGELAAKLHDHSSRWQRPNNFSRMSWGLDEVFGPKAHWGDWRDAPNVDAAVSEVIERAEQRVTHELQEFGIGADRHGLIHADMRLANLLVSGNNITVIDFDDCGFGWFLYDFAAAISFFEHKPIVPELRAAWLAGYRRVRDLPDAHEARLDSLIMLRRLALLAWIGTHREAPEPRALAPKFAKQTAELAERYLMGGF